jgi:hypothetical protein
MAATDAICGGGLTTPNGKVASLGNLCVFCVFSPLIASLVGEALEGDGQEDIGGDHTG